MEKTETEGTAREIENIRMSLSAHLEELRRRVMYSIIAIIFCFIFCWFFKVQILDMAKSPHKFAMGKMGLSTELQV